MKQVAFVGNPNAGKSTLFNALTGANQHVGNWPGKTVERKSGTVTHAGVTLTLIDLPGTYSLSAYSPEELITRDFLLQERPDVVVVVVDAANLERNLYLAVQVLELGLPSLLVLNMMDSARARGQTIDSARLSAALGAPVVETVARRGDGLPALRNAILRLATSEGVSA